MTLEAIRADGVLSFAPETPEIPLQSLNVIIGPNGSGKSNLIEVIELLRAAPTGLAAAIREGGGIREWLWKGRHNHSLGAGTLDARLARPGQNPLHYELTLAAAGARTQVVDEILEEAHAPGASAERYYRLAAGLPTLYVRDASGQQVARVLQRDAIAADESILSQRRDPDAFAELSWCADWLSRIVTFRDWNFGQDSEVRAPQRADLPADTLIPGAINLGMVLNHLEHTGSSSELTEILRRFLPRVQRISTLVQGGTVQFFLHEEGLAAPIPAQRMSDGTLRVLAMAALLLIPTPPPLICLEEPELGLHPDAMTHIASLIVAASARSQLIITTHSDALVSALTDHVESVLTCEYLGGTRLQRLEAGRLQHWLDRYRLGDLWRMGELGGNP